MMWVSALQHASGPTALLLTRQKLPVIARAADFNAADVLKGGYVVSAPETADVVVMASGSEVHVAVEAAATLASLGIRARIVSVPCLEQFTAQPQSYRDAVLPAGIPRVAFEAGRSESWGRLIGCDGLFIGIEHFGASAPDKVLAEQFGFTAPQVAEKIKTFLNK
jgi:transketolase